MRPVVLRPFLTEGLPFSLVREGFHTQKEAVNNIGPRMRCGYSDKINAFKNSVLEFYIRSRL